MIVILVDNTSGVTTMTNQQSLSLDTDSFKNYLKQDQSILVNM